MGFCRGLASFLLILPAVHAEDEAALPYEIPQPSDVHFYEAFQGPLSDSRWVASFAEEYPGDWAIETSEHSLKVDVETGLIVQTEAAKHAISAKFDVPLSTTEAEEIVVQYEVRFAETLECGGAYLKVLQETDSFTPSKFTNDDGYVLMFGPDRCGETDKVHFIIRHQNPITKEIEEKHLTSPPRIKNNLETHVYTVVIRKDDTFELFIDEVSERKGSLHTDFEPPFTPEEKIDDPEDKKPDDWVDEHLMEDPAASKPDDWDEDAPQTITDTSVDQPDGWSTDAPLQIPDPAAHEPSDWDEEDDGVWEAPLVANPACSVGCGEWVRPTIENPDFKGPWKHPMIDNPAYKGEWEPQQIANPGYFECKTPFRDLANMGGVGFEIWTMQAGIEFDNVLLDTSHAAAKAISNQTWRQKRIVERVEEETEGVWDSVTETYNDNPMLIIGAVVVGLVTLIGGAYLFLMSGDESQPVDDEDFDDEGEVYRSDNADEFEGDEEGEEGEADDAAQAEAEPEPEEQEEEEKEEKVEEKPKTRQRKGRRTRKAE